MCKEMNVDFTGNHGTVVQAVDKPWAKLMQGNDDFRTPSQSSWSPTPIFRKLEIHNYFPDTIPHATST